MATQEVLALRVSTRLLAFTCRGRILSMLHEMVEVAVTEDFDPEEDRVAWPDFAMCFHVVDRVHLRFSGCDFFRAQHLDKRGDRVYWHPSTNVLDAGKLGDIPGTEAAIETCAARGWGRVLIDRFGEHVVEARETDVILKARG